MVKLTKFTVKGIIGLATSKNWNYKARTGHWSATDFCKKNHKAKNAKNAKKHQNGLKA
jgi:hypothetical protein